MGSSILRLSRITRCINVPWHDMTWPLRSCLGIRPGSVADPLRPPSCQSAADCCSHHPVQNQRWHKNGHFLPQAHIYIYMYIYIYVMVSHPKSSISNGFSSNHQPSNSSLGGSRRIILQPKICPTLRRRSFRAGEEGKKWIDRNNNLWLVLGPPLWKIWVRQLGWLFPTQY